MGLEIGGGGAGGTDLFACCLRLGKVNLWSEARKTDVAITSRIARTIPILFQFGFHGPSISCSIGLCGGVLCWLGAGVTDLYDREVVSVGLLIDAEVALIAGCRFSIRCIDPLYPQPR